jgi:hypothetical protein
MRLIDVGNATALEALGLGIVFLHGYVHFFHRRKGYPSAKPIPPPSTIKMGGLSAAAIPTTSRNNRGHSRSST